MTCQSFDIFGPLPFPLFHAIMLIILTVFLCSAEITLAPLAVLLFVPSLLDSYQFLVFICEYALYVRVCEWVSECTNAIYPPLSTRVDQISHVLPPLSHGKWGDAKNNTWWRYSNAAAVMTMMFHVMMRIMPSDFDNECEQWLIYEKENISHCHTRFTDRLTSIVMTINLLHQVTHYFTMYFFISR